MSPLQTPAPVAGTPQSIAILAFAREHAATPWPSAVALPPAPASELYDAYVAWCAARGETPLPREGRTSFGSVLADVADWVTRTRPSAGIAYHGITIESRAERARRAVLYGEAPMDKRTLWWQETQPRREAARQRHRELSGHRVCSCPIPASVTDRITAEVDAALAARVASGEVDQLAAERYLTWVPDATPETVAWVSRVVAALSGMPDDDAAPADQPGAGDW